MNKKLQSRFFPFFKTTMWIACFGTATLLTGSVLQVQAIEKTENSKQTSVRGTVKDLNGETLIGVSILVKGTTIGTTTDMDGNFTINAPSNSTLVFTYIGFASQEVAINNQNQLNVVLETSGEELDQVVVVGYGTQKKVNLTGAVSTVDAKQLESRPVQNVGQALQGLVPGLNLQTGGLGGELNQNLSFNIRGGGTIGDGSNSSPLVLIDGMEGNMNALNPQDIESISVLKDAASAAIYGSRAPFGVILITTKSGKAGKTQVNYSNNFRWSKPLGLANMMDSKTFAYYFNEASTNDGQSPSFSDEVLERIDQFQKGEIDHSTVPNANGDRYEYYTGSNGNTDWFKEHYKSAALSHDHSLSVSGGSEKTQYFVSGNYLDQGGLTRHAHDGFKRYSLSGKITTALSDYIKLNYSSRFVREDFTKASHMDDLFYHNIGRRWPTVPVTDPNGNYSEPGEIAQLENGGRVINQTDYLYQQAQLVVTPKKGWNIVADANYRVTTQNNHSDVRPTFAYDVEGNPYAIPVGYNSAGYSSVYEYNNKANYFSSNIYSDYEFRINEDHYFKVLGGFNSELDKYRTIGASRSGLINLDQPTINTGTNESKATEGQYQHWATAGFFGRINYNYKEKYLLEINGRYDGSSRFLRDQRWNLFPSFSAGWNLSKEEFFPWKDQIQLFKVRASYGELGNQDTKNWYPFYLSMPFTANAGSWLLNGEKPNISSAPGIVSSLLTWERVTSWNVGLDLALLNNRLTANLDLYKRNTFDMVGPAPELPVILGTDVPKVNNADMESYGFEIELGWSDRIGEFGYSVHGVLSDDQQRITRYPNKTGDISQYYDGKKWGEIWGYTTIGIAKTQAEMDAHLANVSQSILGSNWGAGDIMYADLDGDGKIDGGNNVLSNPGDKSIIGNSSPRYRFSLDLSADYKGFDARVFLQGVGKRDYMPNGPYFWGAQGGMWQSAGFTTHMDFFRDETSNMVQAGVADVNPDSYYPKPYFNTGKNQETQSRYIQNAAYLRVKNIQLGYTLPQSISNRIKLSNVRFYVSGENLFTITSLSEVFDPETIALEGWNDGKVYPLSKVYSFGINVNF